MKVVLNRGFVCLTFIFSFLLCCTQKSSAQQAGVRTVVIDPGHGGNDPGTVFGEYKEKDINLKVALLLGDMITKNLPDVKVVYTRKTDVAVGLSDRGEIANKAGADLFISIHVNSVPRNSTAPSGTETFVMGPGRAEANLDIAMRENDVISYEEDYSTKYEGYVPGSAESFIIFSLMQYAYIDQSMTMANIMQQHYKKNSLRDRGAKQANLIVLWKISMPGVLTELGFLPNADDRRMMTSAEGQKKLATCLFNSFSEYKSKVEGRSRAIQIEYTEGTATQATTSAAVSTTPSATTNTTSSSTANSDRGVVFRVQVCTSTQKLGFNGSMLRQFKDMGITERKVGSVWKYSVGECSTYTEAAALQTRARRIRSDAFMVAFRGEEQITIAEARRLTE